MLTSQQLDGPGLLMAGQARYTAVLDACVLYSIAIIEPC